MRGAKRQSREGERGGREGGGREEGRWIKGRREDARGEGKGERMRIFLLTL